jgi:hypothetical protein
LAQYTYFIQFLPDAGFSSQYRAEWRIMDQDNPPVFLAGENKKNSFLHLGGYLTFKSGSIA